MKIPLGRVTQHIPIKLIADLLSYIPFRNSQDRLGKKRKKTKQMIVSRISDRHFFIFLIVMKVLLATS